MNKVQLYIEGQRVDLEDNVQIEVKSYIKDMKDLGKVFTDFSKPFSVPASPRNNKIFKHFYNFNIDNAFDARTQKNAEIYLNYQLYRRGKVFLEGVDMRNRVPNRYRIEFFGNTISLKDRFSDDKISGLDLSDFDHNYDYSTIRSIFKGSGFTANSDGPGYVVSGDTESLIYPLITPKKRLFYDSDLAEDDELNYDGNLYDSDTAEHNRGVTQEDLKPAIKVYYIIKAIEAKYDLVLIPNDTSGTDDFFSRHNDAISNLYFWLSNHAGNIAGRKDQEAYFYKQIPDTYTLTADSDEAISWFSNNGDEFTITKDFTEQVRTKGGNSKRGYVFKIDISTNVQTEDIPWLVQILDEDNDEVFSRKGTGDHTWEFDLGVSTVDRTFKIKFSSQRSITTGVTLTFRAVNRKNDAIFVFNESREAYKTFINTTSNQKISASEYASDMKIMDFITGLMKMFNLVAYYVDDETDSEYGVDSAGNANVVKFRTLDNYYNDAVNNQSGGIIDVTEYIDEATHTVNTSLPFSEVSFKYEDNDTIIRDNHKQISNGKIFGNSETSILELFKKAAIFVGEKYEIKVPFTILKYEHIRDEDDAQTGIQWGYAAGGDFQITEGDLDALPVVPNKGDYTPENIKPLLFYGIRTTLTTPYKIWFTDAGVGQLASEAVTTYYRPSNANETITADSDGEFDTPASYQLTFDSEIEEYSEYESTNSLFEVFHKNYILSVFNSNKRLFTYTGYLPPKVLTILNMNDQLKIQDTIYRINSIVTSLTTGKSKLELINLDPSEIVE